MDDLANAALKKKTRSVKIEINFNNNELIIKR